MTIEHNISLILGCLSGFIGGLLKTTFKKQILISYILFFNSYGLMKFIVFLTK